MPNVASCRNLVAGSGTVTLSLTAAGRPQRMTFSQVQNFYRGEQIQVFGTPGGTLRYTIATGVGNEYFAEQTQLQSGTYSFYRTDPSTSRARGGGPVPATWIPKARHFTYRSLVDQAGVNDFYIYIDTIYPKRRRHPYTGDEWTGQAWLGDDAAISGPGHPVPDLGNRVAALDSLPPVLTTRR